MGNTSPKKPRSSKGQAAVARRERARRACGIRTGFCTEVLGNLTIILSQVQLLMRAAEVTDRDLQQIGQAAQRCTTLIQRISDLLTT